MLSFLPHNLKGILSILLYTINTILLTIPMILLSFFKFILPVKSIVIIIDKILISIATLWIGINSFNSKLFCKIEWDLRGLEKLEKKEWYLVLSNHQSWVDILALQTTLNQRIPMLKFFLKQELIWVPFLGLAWWALDFPFMKRYSKLEIQAKPHLKGKDLESTKKACERFKHTPVSIINFIEGTRFTPQKKALQKDNNFTHLLNPKAGGIAFILGSMGEHLNKIIDVTIVYPGKAPTFWEYISGRVNKIIIDFQVIKLTDSLAGDYFNDPEYKKYFFSYLNNLWQKKDEKIKKIKYS
ncbi:MAG: acyltransferase [Deltaproteobacteria bacterium]|jgi:1-acyl-sn-glycerol-3-phosphate acyltransferase|nr:acyltransferase [Deltaproteobacteria bacterium]